MRAMRMFLSQIRPGKPKDVANIQFAFNIATGNEQVGQSLEV